MAASGIGITLQTTPLSPYRVDELRDQVIRRASAQLCKGFQTWLWTRFSTNWKSVWTAKFTSLKVSVFPTPSPQMNLIVGKIYEQIIHFGVCGWPLRWTRALTITYAHLHANSVFASNQHQRAYAHLSRGLCTRPLSFYQRGSQTPRVKDKLKAKIQMIWQKSELLQDFPRWAHCGTGELMMV